MAITVNPIELYRNVCGIAPAFVPRHVQHKSAGYGGASTLPFPALQSPGELSVFAFYPPNQPINHDALFLAQQLARFAGNCQTKRAKEQRINQANYFLTAAYMGDSKAEPFWEQFT